MNLAVLPAVVTVGPFAYRTEKNLDATQGGRPASWGTHLKNLSKGAEGALRVLQIGDRGCALAVPFAGTFAAFFEKISAFFSHGWQMMTLPRLYGATRDASIGINDITRGNPQGVRPPDDHQIRRRIVSAISKVTDCCAMWSYAAGIFARFIMNSPAKANSFNNAGDMLSLVCDTADAEVAAEDLNRARLSVAVLRRQNGAPDVVRHFVYTQRLALLRLTKSVLGVAAGIFTMGAIVFGATVATTYTVTALAFLLAIAAVAKIVYEQSMSHRPIGMYDYFVPVPQIA